MTRFCTHRVFHVPVCRRFYLYLCVLFVCACVRRVTDIRHASERRLLRYCWRTYKSNGSEMQSAYVIHAHTGSFTPLRSVNTADIVSVVCLCMAIFIMMCNMCSAWQAVKHIFTHTFRVKRTHVAVFSGRSGTAVAARLV